MELHNLEVAFPADPGEVRVRGSTAGGSEGFRRGRVEYKEEAEVFAAAAAQTTVNPAAKVTPHLSPALCPAEPSNLLTRCQNPAPGSPLTLTDVEEQLDMSYSLFYYLLLPRHTSHTDRERERERCLTAALVIKIISLSNQSQKQTQAVFFPVSCWKAIFFCSCRDNVIKIGTCHDCLTQ